MTTLIFKGAHAYTEQGVIPDPLFRLEKGVIAELRPAQEEDEGERIDAEELRIVPGFIDIHIHGAAGADVMDGTEEALHTIARALPAEGTTSFLATTLTQSTADTKQALAAAASFQSDNRCAEMLGVHLEGPFIHPARKGAQPEAFIVPPSTRLFEEFQQAAEGMIRLVTMAPELDEDGLTEKLAGQGVIVSMGHTDATCSETAEALARGVSHATHFYNGMRGFHHRDPGVVGGVLMNGSVRAELIADGVHVSPEACAFTYQQLGAERLLLITDAMRAKGKEDGTYQLGGQQVTVRGSEAVLEDGTLAGSVLRMNEAVRNMSRFSGASFEEAVQMASLQPAKALGISGRKGSLATGKDADFTMLDPNGDVAKTYIKGVCVYNGGEDK
ncbi:N-acetylglucosamine-6-phosphate deacetylase [Alkalicoccus luteus]|uniref:N-acetylglucosamine-6-phosphate deacetylase n=1 Tax=Alkalicoccus luteus TaxID=1237094 RepID=A0A969TTK9_9BACI|nr:N-acetylglucosamine-6-phosphate deacetylase [Alkalicoccus luteus]NJP36127.1 N-acetylglucosamine-6-phosphate deacetylase [Alkalicoccus luteus]